MASNPDDLLTNSDWAKQKWDIWWRGKIVNNADDLLLFLGVQGQVTLSGDHFIAAPDPEDQRRAVADFLHLPAASAMPKKILDELKRRGIA